MRLTLACCLVLALLPAAGVAPELAALAELGHGWRPGSSGSPAAVETAVGRLLAALPPESFELQLGESPDLDASVLPLLGGVVVPSPAAAGPDPGLTGRLDRYLAAAARARARRLAAARWSDTDLAHLVVLALIDPPRFAADPGFRAHVLASLPALFGPEPPPALRDAVLAAVNRLPGSDFATGERLAAAWGAARRSSADRRLDAPPRLLFSADDDPIAASLYSLPAAAIDPADAERLLAAVRRVAPRRTLLVLADPAAQQALAPLAATLGVELLDTWGRAYSPWPRDPLSLVHAPGGAVVVLVRPNVQPGREEDQHLGAALIDALPAALDRAWGHGDGVRWTVSPRPFHNGQVLIGREAAWISLHSLEPRILELLGLPRVPVASFAAPEGIGRYVAAARRAAAELEALYGRPVRFVHPLPAAGAAGAEALMRQIGGGAGYDLDSLLTLLPAGPGRGPGQPWALVASAAAGRQLLAGAGDADVESLRHGFGLAPAAAELRTALAAAQSAPRTAGLDRFLDLVAGQLAGAGFQVHRLPLLAVPTELVAGRHLRFAEFLLTWNNVVLERRDGALRAEGFSALLPAGDELARRLFAAAGCHLDLLPPLTESILFNGGYRCASNQLRQEAAPPTAAARSRRR
jgi:hypothetical protein